MWEINDIVCAGVLGILSWSDLKEKSISIPSLFISNMAFLVLRICSLNGGWKEYISGAFVGLVFLLISIFSKQAIGYADSLIMTGLGFYLGFWKIISLLGTAFFLLAFAGLFLLLKCRWSKKSSIPFLPFLMIGYLGVLLK